MKYILSKLVKTSFNLTLFNIKKELRNEGFIVLKEMDLKNILNTNTKGETKNYIIINITNKLILNQALLADKDIGVLFPFNIILRELINGQVRICVINYSIAMRIFSQYNVIVAASTISNKLKRVFAKL